MAFVILVKIICWSNLGIPGQACLGLYLGTEKA